MESIAGSSTSASQRLMPGKVQDQQRDNAFDLEMEELRGNIEIRINKLEEYRNRCLMNGLCYYDAFKNKKRRDLDFQANLKRLELAGLWDEMGLADDFQCSEEWLRLATHYRLLVEPLDIANYYRLSKDDECGPYLTHGRPRRYKIIQKWFEDNEENNQLRPTGTDQPGLMLTQNSCFWAYVEEIVYLMGTNNVRDQENSAAEFEERVRHLLDSNGLCMEELLAGESTFRKVVKWLWEPMTLQQQASSPFSSIIAEHPELLE